MSVPAWAALSADYAQYHRDPRNKVCHLLGIPMIAFCVVRWTQVGGTAFPLAALVVPLYLYWDAPLGALMAALIALMAGTARLLPAWAFGVLFVVGWALQFLGHRYEGKSPAFTQNLLHFFVGPLWILQQAAVAIFSR